MTQYYCREGNLKKIPRKLLGLRYFQSPHVKTKNSHFAASLVSIPVSEESGDLVVTTFHHHDMRLERAKTFDVPPDAFSVSYYVGYNNYNRKSGLTLQEALDRVEKYCSVTISYSANVALSKSEAKFLIAENKELRDLIKQGSEQKRKEAAATKKLKADLDSKFASNVNSHADVAKLSVALKILNDNGFEVIKIGKK